MLETILAGLVLGVTLAFMVGPVFFILLDTTLNKGVKEAIQFDAGVITADVFFITLFWVSADSISIDKYGFSIFLIGGALIFVFGLYNLYSANKKIDTKSISNTSSDSTSRAPTISGFQKKGSKILFVKGFFINFLNMGVMAYWLTTSLIMRASVDGDNKLMLAFFSSTIFSYAATDGLKIYFAQRIKQKLNNRILYKIEKGVGYILLGFGFLMIVRGFLHREGISF